MYDWYLVMIVVGVSIQALAEKKYDDGTLIGVHLEPNPARMMKHIIKKGFNMGTKTRWRLGGDINRGL